MRRGLLVPVVVALALLAGCTSSGGQTAAPEQGVPTTAQVSADQAATVGVDGVVVEVPAGAVAAPGTLAVAPVAVKELEAVPDGIVPLTSISVTLTGTELVDAATVTFPSPAAAPSGDSRPADPLVVMWQDGTGGWRLLPVEQQQGEEVAQTDHFSIGFLGSIDVQKWAADQRTKLADYLSGRAGAAQPSCGDEQAARASGVTVTSDGGDAVKWCFGVQDGQTVLKLTNNRRSFATVSYPKAWKVKDGSSFSISPDGAARVLGDAATTFVQLGKNRAARTINGGDTLTLVVGENGSGAATVEGDFTAWAFSAIVFGFDVYTTVASTLGVYPKDNDVLTRFAKVVNGEDGDGYWKTFLACTRSQMDQLGNYDGVEDLDDSLAKVLKFMWSCVPQLMTADMKAAGLTMFGAGLVLQAIAGVVGLILTAVHLLTTGVREIYDNFASFGGKSDAIYDVLIRRPKAASTRDLVLSTRGLGPLELGASVAAAERTGMVRWNPTHCPAEVFGSDYGALETADRYGQLTAPNPVGLDGFPSFAVDVDLGSEDVRWIEVYDPAIATTEGIRVGDTVAALEQVYGAELRFGDANYPGQESYVRWLRRGDVDMVFDIFSGTEGVVDSPPARIWSIGVIGARSEHYSNYRTDSVPGAC